MCIRDRIDAARMLVNKGYKLFATGGTHKALAENGIESTHVYCCLLYTSNFFVRFCQINIGFIIFMLFEMCIFATKIKTL